MDRDTANIEGCNACAGCRNVVDLLLGKVPLNFMD
jgi:hypothetical protein